MKKGKCNHTAYSADAFMGGTRLTPKQSYRIARGEEVISPTGIPVKLSRPMDFLVVTDHAKGLGIMPELANGNSLLVSDPTLARWGKAMKGSAQEQTDAMSARYPVRAGQDLTSMVHGGATSGSSRPAIPGRP